MVKIYDSKTRRKEDFVPLDPGGERVGLYWCGPTVYDSLHLGHGRAAVVPDLVRRYLEFRGYEVRYVTNFTDVDDKIIQRALREGRPWREVTWEYIEEYGRITTALGNRPADAFPRATDHVPEMVELGERLIANGHAYVADNGDVYFDVTSMSDYGALSGRDLEQQRQDAAGRLDEVQLAVKRSPGDFILWKLNENDPPELREHGDRVPGWPSPWGRGRPGWHLECSALSAHYLGMPFDIHGGGLDLLFPHHENERAQNCCGWEHELDGEAPVRYWMHNGFITVKARSEEERTSEHAEGDAVKMSKSLGNVRWLREMIWPEGPYDPLAVRMWLLSSHYRSPMQFAPEVLDQATSRLDRIYGVLEALEQAGLSIGAEAPEDVAAAMAEHRRSFVEGMDDDFNTPAGLATVFELVGWAQKRLFDQGRPIADESLPPTRAAVCATLHSLLQALGFPSRRARIDVGSGEHEQELLELLGELRRQAREEKLWALADRIRDRLGELGFEVRDRSGGEFEIVRR